MTQQSPDMTQQNPDADDVDPQLVPVSESIRYRRRAQQAERQLAELGEQLQSEQQARASAEAELATAQRRMELTRRLAGRGVIDLDAALLLAESQWADAGEDAEAADVVEQLLKSKPYLVSAGGSKPVTMTTPTQGRRAPAQGAAEQLRQAARAAASGKPADLDRYLRLRRRMR